MCAKTHTIYRNARKDLPEKSGFSPKKGVFFLKNSRKCPKMTGKRPEICRIQALKINQFILLQIV
jgi:hypothetical protein